MYVYIYIIENELLIRSSRKPGEKLRTIATKKNKNKIIVPIVKVGLKNLNALLYFAGTKRK